MSSKEDNLVKQKEKESNPIQNLTALKSSTTTLVPTLCVQTLKQIDENVQKHFQTTIFPQMSTQFMQLTSMAASAHGTASLTIASVLSTLQLTQEQLAQRLSAVPVHPYDKFKQLYYKPLDTTIPTLDQLPVPVDFVPLTISAQISALNEKYRHRALAQVAFLSANPNALQDYGQLANYCNAFAAPVDGQFMVSTEEVSNHFHFLETVKSLNYNDLAKDPILGAKKLLKLYLDMYE